MMFEVNTFVLMVWGAECKYPLNQLTDENVEACTHPHVTCFLLQMVDDFIIAYSNYLLQKL
jgi:hypothetical protein